MHFALMLTTFLVIFTLAVPLAAAEAPALPRVFPEGQRPDDQPQDSRSSNRVPDHPMTLRRFANLVFISASSSAGSSSPSISADSSTTACDRSTSIVVSFSWRVGLPS